jgi:L-iditol 2-dehydrogenase
MQNVKAAIIPDVNEPVEVQEIPFPEIEPGGAMMRVNLSEVCGTDVYLQQGRLAEVQYPLIPGHVSAGRIERLRGRVRDIDGRTLREGDPVTFLDVHRTCHRCWHCLVAKASTRCPERKVYGITYGLEDGLTGGWAEMIYLKPETRIIRLEETNQERFMAGGCGLPTALHAVERVRIGVGDSVLVLGSGPVGLSAVILSRMQGASQVLCIGAPENRLRTAEEVGADSVLNFEVASELKRREWVLERTQGRGADVTIEATGAPEAVVQAMRFTRDAGRVVIVGQYTDHGEVGFNPHLDLNKKHLDVLGCWGSDFSHFYRAVQIMSDPEWSQPWARIPLVRFGLEQCNEALESVSSGEAVKALIDPWQ